MKLLLENWREYLKEINPTGRREGEIYIKSLSLNNPELEVYKRAVGQEIRGIAKVFDVNDGEIKMEYVAPYSNSKGIYDIDKDEEITYKIVGNLESKPEEGQISIDTPIARGLVGKFEEDEVVIETPAGKLNYEIIQVKHI